MSLIKWEPFNGFDSFFDDRHNASFSRPSWDLAVDVYEEKGNLVSKISLPDVDANDIEVSYDDNILTVVGRRKEEEEIDEKDYYSKEIRRGSFSRSVRLPKSVDATKAEASYVNGTLKVVAPLITGAESSVVKVKVKH